MGSESYALQLLVCCCSAAALLLPFAAAFAADDDDDDDMVIFGGTDARLARRHVGLCPCQTEKGLNNCALCLHFLK